MLSHVQAVCGRRASAVDASGTAAATVPEWLLWFVRDPAKDAVQVRAAHGAFGLRHPGALLVDVYLAGGLPAALHFTQ